MSVAQGTMDPGLPFYQAICDGEGEALLMKAQMEAARKTD